MIVACPLCQTRYLVPAALFVGGSRVVRCARCSHSWQAELPKEIEVVSPLDPLPVTEPPPVPPGSNLPALRGVNWDVWLRSLAVISGALLVIALLWLLLNREDAARGWPAMRSFYDTVGLHLAYPGEGLAFVDVHSELVYDGGVTKLAVDGKIKNKTSKSLIIPVITATALGPEGDTMQSWQIDAPAATLAPDAAVPFRSSINAPKGTVSNVNLNFVEPMNDADR